MMDLLDYAEQRARQSDPLPSKVAASEIEKDLSELQKQFLQGLRELGQATANEVAAHLTDNFARRNTLRRRASDLVGKHIRDIGSRKCKETRRLATVYEVIE
jgi:hypothetical protein